MNEYDRLMENQAFYAILRGATEPFSDHWAHRETFGYMGKKVKANIELQEIIHGKPKELDSKLNIVDSIPLMDLDLLNKL